MLRYGTGWGGCSELLADLDRNTVDFQAKFDDSTNEPVMLSSPIPKLPIKGGTSIAAGMATSIP